MRSLLLIAALCTGYASEASAQGQGPRVSFETIDSNGDGVLSEAEMRSFGELAFEQRFAQADADGDGALSSNEIQAMQANRANGRMGQMMGRLDQNQDGLLQYAELSRMADRNPIFSRLDANGDGEVSRDEFERRRR